MKRFLVLVAVLTLLVNPALGAKSSPGTSKNSAMKNNRGWSQNNNSNIQSHAGSAKKGKSASSNKKSFIKKWW